VNYHDTIARLERELAAEHALRDGEVERLVLVSMELAAEREARQKAEAATTLIRKEYDHYADRLLIVATRLRLAEDALRAVRQCVAAPTDASELIDAHFARFPTSEPAPTPKGPRCNGKCAITVGGSGPYYDPACPLHGELRGEAK
jgi:hypothetical protein